MSRKTNPVLIHVLSFGKLVVILGRHRFDNAREILREKKSWKMKQLVNTLKTIFLGLESSETFSLVV